MKVKTPSPQQESGQAILEYILLLTILLSMGSILVYGVQSARDGMWKRLICEVSSACVDCKSTESAKKALPNSGVNCKK